MDRNPGDWSVEHLFGEIGAFDCSRARFGALLEQAVHPLSRSGDDQTKTVAALNAVLARDGYELAQEGEISGHPLFSFRSLARGVSGRPKNLIFASRGPKPEIGFADAINNDIVILSGEESCLVYDRPIGASGLLWSELVSWWGEATPRADAAKLGARLQEGTRIFARIAPREWSVPARVELEQRISDVGLNIRGRDGDWGLNGDGALSVWGHNISARDDMVVTNATQPEWTINAGTLIERTRCVRCHKPLAGRYLEMHERGELSVLGENTVPPGPWLGRSRGQP